MTTKEMSKLADMVAERIVEMQERNQKPITLPEASRLYGWSKSFLYKNHVRMGAIKAGGKIFFFPHNLNQMIRAGALPSRENEIKQTLKPEEI